MLLLHVVIVLRSNQVKQLFVLGQSTHQIAALLQFLGLIDKVLVLVLRSRGLYLANTPALLASCGQA